MTKEAESVEAVPSEGGYSHIGLMTAPAQQRLFEHPRASPVDGLTYVPEAVNEADERGLVMYLDTLDFQHFAYRGFTGNRRTVSFGWRYDFNGGGFQEAAPLPEPLVSVRAQVASALGQPPQAFEQCSVIEYTPGAGIGWHKDRPQFGKVAGLSLLAPCRFRLRRKRGAGFERVSVLLEPRSAYLLDGDARHLWHHSIPVLDALRYSVTFRTLSSAGESLVNR